MAIDVRGMGLVGGHGTEVLCLRLPCDRRAAGAVRAAIHDLESLGWVLDDIVLAASELVSNAVRHSGGGPEDVITVRAVVDANLMTLSVHDPGRSQGAAHLPAPDAARAGGRGLRIVDRLATEWGSDSRAGNRVWAEFDLGARPPRARRFPASGT